MKSYKFFVAAVFVFFTAMPTLVFSQKIKSVKIGSQIWMAENLSVDHFQNGEIIPYAGSLEAWKEAGGRGKPAWCYYNDDSSNDSIYGKLYNWYAVNDIRKLAPQGWHIPADSEWVKLSENLGGVDVAGYKMKGKAGWTDFDGKSSSGSDESGFNGLPGGYRSYTGDFSLKGYTGYWWSKTEVNASDAKECNLYFSSNKVNLGKYYKKLGFSIRCVKN